MTYHHPHQRPTVEKDIQKCFFWCRYLGKSSSAPCPESNYTEVVQCVCRWVYTLCPLSASSQLSFLTRAGIVLEGHATPDRPRPALTWSLIRAAAPVGISAGTGGAGATLLRPGKRLDCRPTVASVDRTIVRDGH